MKIDASVTKAEYDAIKKYAQMCGESVPEIIRKILIQEITLMKSTRDIPQKYDYHMLVPDGMENEDTLIEQNYNQIRQMLGLRNIRLS
jgi:uncharacterized protein YutE (UPF0331/DUF86 family)